MSITTETAKLIVEYLKGIFPDAECRRSYLPVVEPDELDEIGKTVLCVVPVEKETERYTQGGTLKHDIALDICINAKLNHRNDEHEEQLAEIDKLIAFSEKVYAAFLKKVEKSSGDFRAAFTQPKHLVVSDPEIMQNRNCFLGVVQVSALVLTKPEGGVP
jgi:hypothetical protein